MEIAVIDWENIDSRFVKDEYYENIVAPKWVDFSSPDDPVDDEAWFCRPSCDHPKTVEDFLKEKQMTPNSFSKLHRSASVSDIPPLGERNKRDATLKKRGINQHVALSSKNSKYNIEEGENQDPNFSTPPNPKAKPWKNAIKSSAEKQQNDANVIRKEQAPKLKSTMSARNLFSGGDLLNKVAEFCTELKKMATRAKDRERQEDNLNRKDQEKHKAADYVNENADYHSEKERRPLLDLSKEKSEMVDGSGSKGKLRRKKRNNDVENTPMSMDVKNVKRQGADGGLQQIRTCPPTPQGFSAGRGPLKASTTPKAFNSKLQEKQDRGILQELKHNNNKSKSENRTELSNEKSSSNYGGEMSTEKETTRTLDVFCFLKPCTLSS